MKANHEQRKTSLYLLLLAAQILGAITLIWQILPEFRQLAINPGDQLPRDGFSDMVSVGVLCVMQISFWCRVRFVPIPFRRPRTILNHIFLFLGKLSFLFGSAFFGIIVFRHLPELDRGTDFLLAAKRGMVVMGCLFALFCTSLEVERLGQAFDASRN
jgi:DMSO/TMAO reductase YedYZ heme-binding membrane subunit